MFEPRTYHSAPDVGSIAVRFLVRNSETRTLTAFAIYCLVVGAASALRFGIG